MRDIDALSTAGLLERFATFTCSTVGEHDARLLRQPNMPAKAFRPVDDRTGLVRRLGDGVYRGIGTCGFTDGQRATPLPFLLERSVRPYRGDIGTARVGFRITRREVPALTEGRVR